MTVSLHFLGFKWRGIKPIKHPSTYHSTVKPPFEVGLHCQSRLIEIRQQGVAPDPRYTRRGAFTLAHNYKGLLHLLVASCVGRAVLTHHLASRAHRKEILQITGLVGKPATQPPPTVSYTARARPGQRRRTQRGLLGGCTRARAASTSWIEKAPLPRRQQQPVPTGQAREKGGGGSCRDTRARPTHGTERHTAQHRCLHNSSAVAGATDHAHRQQPRGTDPYLQTHTHTGPLQWDSCHARGFIHAYTHMVG